MVGAVDKGNRLNEEIERDLAKIRKAGESFSRKPRVYFEEWDEPMISGIRWVSELVGIAGGEDVFPGQSLSQAATGRIVSSAAVIEQRPDVILGSWCGKKFRPEKVAARAGWNAIPAVQNEMIFEIKSADIRKPGPAALHDGVRRIHEIRAPG
jgi:iron complex transport system substrate-binding protein